MYPLGFQKDQTQDMLAAAFDNFFRVQVPTFLIFCLFYFFCSSVYFIYVCVLVFCIFYFVSVATFLRNWRSPWSRICGSSASLN